MDGTKPISKRERELLGMDSIASQMPVEFPNGACWTELIGECKFCRREIPDDLLRGSVTRPLPSVTVVEAVGVCPDCRIATPFLYRMHDDRRLTGPCDGGWCTWMAKPSLWERFKSLLRWS